MKQETVVKEVVVIEEVTEAEAGKESLVKEPDFIVEGANVTRSYRS